MRDVSLTDLDRRLLRAIRAAPAHGYALVERLAEEGAGVDRATVYRRLAALARGGLVAVAVRRGRGAPRKEYRLAALGEAELRDELRRAVQTLFGDYHARARRAASGGRGAPRVRGPIVFVSGSRVSPVEARILASFARAAPRNVHLALSPGAAPPPGLAAGVAVVEAPWSSLPFRDAYARILLVNELPPARLLARASREWARALARDGTLHVVAPAPLTRGVDAFLDYFADLQRELFPDVADAPPPAAVTRALEREFKRVDVEREGTQIVWSARSSRG